MKVISEKKWIVLTVAILLLTSAALLWHKNVGKQGLKINCSTIIYFYHADPAYASTLEMKFRLDSDYNGLVVLSGNIETASGRQTVYRNITFDYDVKTPGEIIVRNMSYIKTLRDTALDGILTRSFFYVPEGTERQLQLSPLRNAWLLGNQQSPFALCVNIKH